MDNRTDLSEISRDNILEAIKKYSENSDICGEKRKPKKYYLVYNGKEYPLKCIVGIAYNISKGLPGVLAYTTYLPDCNQNYCASKIVKERGFEVKKRRYW